MPDLTKQRQGEDFFAEVSRLTHLQAKTVSEMDAILPSVISRVFAGELLV
jgi:hypothetical protein